ncbi:MAG: DUF5110 domain-containing protein [Pseudoflavonifractor sp.]|nr:DUF5110 domain-containing protein [Pseudoflavonifractor sp.]
MIKTHYLLPGLMMAVSAVSYAAPGVITTTTGNGRVVTLTAMSDDIIRVTNASVGETVPASASAVLKPGVFNGSVSTSGNVQVMTTPTGLVATLDNKTGAVTFSASGNVLADSGVRTSKDGKQKLELSTAGHCSFYGAGERGHKFNLNGDTLVMYNRQNYGYVGDDPRISQMNITMPMFVSSAGYAVLFDDYAAAEMIMSNPVEYITEGKEPVSYYFINGAGTLAGVSKQFTALTGRQKLPPFWSLGYITSKYGYKTEAETRGVIDTLKLNGYPVDGVVLDLYWYGKEQDMGRLAWDPEQWPTHHKMLKDMKNQGVNTVIISQPYILRNSRGLDNYNYLASRGMLAKDSVGNPHDVTIWVGEGGMFDVSNPDTRQWLRERYKQLTDDGVTGWWGDLGEPEVHPETIFHHNGKTAREYHNQYGNDWSSIISDLFEEEYPETRLMTMMRGGTAGLQRYSVFPWSTDVSRSWGGMAPQVTIMLNSGLSGLGYMSHDVGGFAIDEERPVDPELYVRWLQLGTFSPILRTHAQQVAEPYRYPEQQDIILDLIRKRYRWLPYNYTLAYENASQGLPLVRPLGYYSKGDTRFDNVTDQYLWGRDVMVAPVMKQGAVSRQVVFPDGIWVDMLNPSKVYLSGDTIEYAAPLEVLPMFARAGAFIPQAAYDMKNTGDYDTSRYSVIYYPRGGESAFTMYEDDRTSAKSLDRNEYALVTFEGDDTDTKTVINAVMSGSYPGMPQSRTITFELPGVNAPKAVTCDGKKLRKSSKGTGCYSYNASTATLTITVDWKSGTPLNLEVIKNTKKS